MPTSETQLTGPTSLWHLHFFQSYSVSPEYPPIWFCAVYVTSKTVLFLLPSTYIQTATKYISLSITIYTCPAPSERIPPLSAYAYVLLTAPFKCIPPPSAYVLSTATSGRHLHQVNLFRTWTYCPMVPFPQPAMDNKMETYQVGYAGGKRGNPKERIPK
jgi:hypothetical protein